MRIVRIGTVSKMDDGAIGFGGFLFDNRPAHGHPSFGDEVALLKYLLAQYRELRRWSEAQICVDRLRELGW